MQQQEGVKAEAGAGLQLVERLNTTGSSRIWDVGVNTGFLPYLKDHRLQGAIILPGAFYIEVAVAAAAAAFGETPRILEDIAFHKMLVLPENGTKSLQMILSEAEGGQAVFRFYSYPEGGDNGDESGTLYASLKISLHTPGNNPKPPNRINLDEARSRCQEKIDAEAFYSGMYEDGNQYGRAFRLIERLQRGDGEALGELRAPDAGEAEFADHYLHPVLLDAASQMVLAAANRSDGRTCLLAGFDQVRLYGPSGASSLAYARSRPCAQADGDVLMGDACLLDSSGQKTVELLGTRFRQFAVAHSGAMVLADSAQMTIAVAATFTAEPLEEILAFWMSELDVPHRIVFAPYNQPFQQLLDPSSLLSKNRTGLNLILLRFDDLLRGDKSLVAGVDPAEKERLLANHLRHTIPGDIEIAHLNQYETEYLFNEIFAEKVYLKHNISLHDEDCVIDVGANIGLFALFVQQQRPRSQVYAFEPSPPAFDALSINAKLYGPNIKVFNYGLSDQNKEALFTFYKQSSVFSGFYADPAQDGAALKAIVQNILSRHHPAGEGDLRTLAEEMITGRLESESHMCRLKTLSSVIEEQGIDRIDLLKIDAEKSEMDVLRGIKEEHWGIIKQVVIEVHDGGGEVARGITTLLRERGFELHVEEEELLKGSGFYNIYAARVSKEKEASARASVSTEEYDVLEQNVADFVGALRTAQQRSPAAFVVCVCPASPALLRDTGRRSLFERMEQRLASEMASLSAAHLIRPSDLLAAYPVSDYYDPHTDELGHVPYTRRFFAALGTMIARTYHAIQRAPYKVIVLDCDQTLWKGLCGENGPTGIEIDAPRRRLQEFMVEQHDAGMLLCLCSRNNEEDVDAVFEHHPEMPLRRDHFVCRRINWRAKSENIKSLSEELGLSLDSFVIVDDNPVECAEVEAHCPEVLALQLPPEADSIPKFLAHVWAFDHLRTTEEDKGRTQSYQQNIRREGFRHDSLTFKSFLEGLALEVRFSNAASPHLPRMAQLTQRTNQFNFTTIRRSESELRGLLESGELEGLLVEVSDRFGDYGLVGLILYGFDSEALVVDTLLLSCRVLGKGVEHRMLNRLGEIAVARGLDRVSLRYRPTRKNQPALEFLNSVGVEFRESPDGRAASLTASPLMEETKGEFIFNIPADFLIGVAFNPETAGENPEGAPAEGESSSGAFNFLYKKRPSPAPRRQVAAGLHNVDQVLDAIESQKYRRRPNLPDGFAAPGNEIERTITSIWQEMLGMEEVGINDNFFDLGGTSLQAALVISELESRLGLDVSTLSLFDKTTVSSMAEMLKSEGEKDWGEKMAARRERGERRRARSLKRMLGSRRAPRP